ncbi:MAG: TatD family hydrolase [Paludibacter sp.]|jgi:TatD DNase family protein|nr:TatD family hydrolase [Paludibacter sp.]
MIMFFDVHSHTFKPNSKQTIVNLEFDDAEEFFASTRENFVSVGFHPCFLDVFSENNFAKLKRWATDKRVKTLGECGLDKYSRFDLKTQILVFERQVILSEKAGKSLVIHCIGRANELLAIKRAMKPAQLWIIHGFRGKAQLAEQFLKADCALSFGEFFNVESVKITPLDKLFIETDESAKDIADIYFDIAKIKNCKIENLKAGQEFFENFS